MKYLFCLGGLLMLVFSCNQNESAKNNNSGDIPATHSSGRELAQVYCASCHAFVRPESLPRASWENDVLPAMGNRLGIYHGGRRPDSIFGSPRSRPSVKKANVFPEKPLLAQED